MAQIKKTRQFPVSQDDVTDKITDLRRIAGDFSVLTLHLRTKDTVERRLHVTERPEIEFLPYGCFNRFNFSYVSMQL